MKAYGDTIADTVRRQEVLQAKVNIHDGLNRMILATKKSVEADCSRAERADILRMWQGQVLLLCREAGGSRSTNVVSDLKALAAAIGIEIVWENTPKTESAQVLALFLSAAREAMANAVKHAGATRLTILIKEDDASLCAEFTNDGEKPTEPVPESGGLKSLRQRLESAGGRLQIDAENASR
jgi:two-component system sensor histidine kinase DesK